jgi:nucleoside-diphosphate-sugar epimerase
MMPILLSGLSGFTGHYVQQSLESLGYSVVGLQSDLMDSTAINNEIALLKPRHVIHLAGKAFVGHGITRDFYDINLIGTHHLLQALAKISPNVERIILASTALVYGAQSHDKTLHEKSALKPEHDYAVSKLAMEYMASLWQDKLPIMITRPFNYTGVGQSIDFLVPKIVHHFRERAPSIALGNLDVWREMNDVRFVADIYCQLLNHFAAGKTLNICSGIGHSPREIIALCEKITNHTLDVIIDPRFVRPHEASSLLGNVHALHAHITPQITPTLEDTLTWMLNHPDEVARNKS